MNNLAIIPARGGSKRIPRKNIKDFLGKPIISYSIEAALNSELFDEVMVSTDDDEIAEVAIKYGAKVPFLRSKKNSDDYSGTGDVCLEVLENYSKNGIIYESCCCIYATAPLIQEHNLNLAYKLLLRSNFDTVLPICKFSSPIWRSFNLKKDSKLLIKNFPENEVIKRSQDLEDSYFDAGQFYWFTTNQFFHLSNKNIFGQNRGAIILNDLEVQDIDNIIDLEIAALKYKIIRKI
jgi:N-acylneuraminate cytidylyltransferase